MRNLFTALSIMVIGVSACTTVEGAGEVTIDVTSSPEAVSGEDALPIPDTGSGDSAVSVDTSDDTSSEDVMVVDLAPEDVSTVDLSEDVPTDIPEECEDGGCFLQPCDEPSDCFSGICVPHLGGKVCSETCEADCPNGFTCSLISMGGGDPAYICLSAYPNLCQPCHTTSDCTEEGASSACLVYGEQGSFCGGSCDEDSDCPSGYSCEDSMTTSGGSSLQCVSSTAQCDCSSNSMNLALSTPCSISNDHGACSGLRVCTGTGLSECDAAEPTAELCDGLDNDCDSSTDEDVDCLDDNPCTENLCGGSDGCVYSPLVGADCDDGASDTLADVCDEDALCSGTPYVCPEPTTCTPSHTQDGETCLPKHEEAGAPCDDGDASTLNDICDGVGGCMGSPFGCPPASACTPGYTQIDGECTPTYADAGAPCNDGAMTTQADVCDGEGGCAGTTYECPAPSACIPEYIQDGSGCIPDYAGAGVTCDDGVATTLDDVCNGSGTCAGAPYQCPAPTTCTPSHTQDGQGCLPNHAGAGTLCNDGDPATQSDVCDGTGECFGTPFGCPPASVCTPSYTQDGGGCTPNHADFGTVCDDGLASTQNDVCSGFGVCSGDGYECPAPTTCTPSYTQDGDGCTANHAGAGTACNDGNNASNNDVCNGSGGCSGTSYTCPGVTTCTPSYSQDGSGCTPNYAGAGVLCNDNNNATSSDVCNGAGTCLGTPFGCPGITTCTPSYSQDGNGCLANYAPSGSACNDGNNGTSNDVCNGAGSCLGTPYGCPGGTTCTPSYIQDGSGCVANHAPSGSGCNDSNNGTKNDVCNGAGSCSGSPYGCPGGTTCTPSYSQNGSGCVANHAPSGSGCNDGNNGTKNDVCNGAGSCSGSPYGCPGGTTCTPSYSQDGSGCVANHAGAGTGCNDSNNGTSNDVCNGAGSCSGSPYNCPGGTPCTPSYNQDGSGCTANHAGAGTGCNDNNNGTNNDVCNGSGSCSGAPYGCPGGTTCTPSYSQDGSGCVANHAGAGTGCDDSINTTNNDVCNGSGSCSGAPYGCPGTTTCTPFYIQDGSGCIANHAGAGTSCNDNNNGTTNDVCDGAGGCAGDAAFCGNGIVEAGEACDGGSCCSPTCTAVPNGTKCGKPEPWECDVNVCQGGSCSGWASSCDFNEHCCEGGCWPWEMQCP